MGFLDRVESLAGQVIDLHAHIVGGVLDGIGLDEAGHEVDKWGDGIADDLGLDVGELNLGESDDPKELVHGDVHAIGDTVAHLRKFASAFEETGAGLSRMDSDHWQGKAADAFRQKFSTQPTEWRVTADACEAAAKALEALASTITWAQGQAQQAIDTYDQAKKASDAARSAHEKQTWDYDRAVSQYNLVHTPGQSQPTAPAPFQDPGTEGKKHAAEMLLTARKARVDAAHTAEQAIKAATSNAPKEPGLMDRLGMDILDAPVQAVVGLVHFEAGLAKGGADLLKFGRGLNPLDVYNITHPAMFLDHLVSVGTGLIHTENHPTELLSAVAGSGWGSDPAEAGGKAVFNLISGVATGGGSEAGAVAERLAADAAENAAERDAIKAGESAAENAGRDAADNARWSNLRDFYNAPKGDWAGLARPSDGVESSAVHAGSVDPVTAQKFLDDQYQWMRDVNRPRLEAGLEGYNQNCSENVIAVNQQLDGIDAIADPLEKPRWPDPAKLGDPKATWGDAYSYDNIVQDMKARGEGSRGVVYISRADGTAHVFNVINDGNGVVFLDGQTGTLGHLEPNATSIKYMPYR